MNGDRAFSQSFLSRRIIVLLAAILAGLAMSAGLMLAARASSAQVGQASRVSTSLKSQLQDVQAPTAALEVKTESDLEFVQPGGVLQFTITYSNTSGVAIPGVTIIDTIGPKQEFSGIYSAAPGIPDTQFTYNGNPDDGYTLNWTIGSLPAGSGKTIVFNTHVVTSAIPLADNPVILLGNSVRIQSTSPSYPAAEDDAVATVVGPILQISKAVGPDPVLPGHRLFYTLTVENLGRLDSIPANGVQVTDILPEYTQFYTGTRPVHYYTDTNLITWDLAAPIASGNSRTLTFTVDVLPTANSGLNIRNNKNEYHVGSSEMGDVTVQGEVDANAHVGKLLQKTVLARRMGSSYGLAYPGELITYTLTVYNPLTTTLNGVVVTDTLPGDPDPFVFQAELDGQQPPQILNGGWDLVYTVNQLPPLGSATRVFSVLIPRNTVIADNRTYTEYKNDLSARHPDFDFEPEDNLATVRVETPLRITKTVSPNHAKPGELVEYTINLENVGIEVINQIRLTDTLPADFTFDEMVDGPQPLVNFRTNPVVWSGLSVQPGQEYALTFSAIVDGPWLARLGNTVCASSPVSYIPCKVNTATVLVDSPILISKTANPTEIYINSIFNYAITLTNDSIDTWRLVSVRDFLPTGFYEQNGGNPAVLNTNATIAPGDHWTTNFTILASPDIPCSGLPKTYRNTRGSLELHVTEPYDVTAYNASDLAPLLVKPNIQVDLIPHRRYVQRGMLVTFDLHLNNVSTQSANAAMVQLTLDPYLLYQQTIQGPQPTVIGNQLTWTNLNLGSLQEMHIRYTARVADDAPFGWKNTTYSASAFNVCFGELGTGDSPIGTGRVNVTDDIVELSKTARNDQVAPLALVDYDLSIKNNDSYEVTLSDLTDTIPDGFTYYSVSSGPQPTTVSASTVVWQNLVLEPSSTLHIHLLLKSSSLYKVYYNYLTANTSDFSITGAQETVQVLPLFDLLKTPGVNQARPGSYVPYLIRLVNLSDTSYDSIVITDTLPAGFTYYAMFSGPPPTSLGPGRSQPVWSGLALSHNCSGGGGCSLELGFYAFVQPTVAEDVYWNEVIGYSPSGSIPGPILTAPVEITENPLDKTIYLPLLQR